METNTFDVDVNVRPSLGNTMPRVSGLTRTVEARSVALHVNCGLSGFHADAVGVKKVDVGVKISLSTSTFPWDPMEGIKK